MRLNKTNGIVRTAITQTGHTQWEVARKLGYGESVFSRRLREELPLNEQYELAKQIARIEW